MQSLVRCRSQPDEGNLDGNEGFCEFWCCVGRVAFFTYEEIFILKMWSTKRFNRLKTNSR